jgi:hypothetical protein
MATLNDLINSSKKSQIAGITDGSPLSVGNMIWQQTGGGLVGGVGSSTKNLLSDVAGGVENVGISAGRGAGTGLELLGRGAGAGVNEFSKGVFKAVLIGAGALIVWQFAKRI